MDILSDAHLEFFLRVLRNPGSKLNGGEAYHPDGTALWPMLEERLLIRCVGGYKWEPTEVSIIMVKSALAPMLAMKFFVDLQKQIETLRNEVATLKGDCDDQRRMKVRAREQRARMSSIAKTSHHEVQRLRHAVTDLEKDMGDLARADRCWNAVVGYVLGAGATEDPLVFLSLWNEGEFDALRSQWPDAPEAIYLADSQLHTDGWYEDESGNLRYRPEEALQSTSNEGEKVYPGIAHAPAPEGGVQILEKGEQVMDISDLFPPSKCELCYDTGRIAVDDPIDAPITTAPCPACKKEE